MALTNKLALADFQVERAAITQLKLLHVCVRERGMCMCGVWGLCLHVGRIIQVSTVSVRVHVCADYLEGVFPETWAWGTNPLGWLCHAACGKPSLNVFRSSSREESLGKMTLLDSSLKLRAEQHGVQCKSWGTRLPTSKQWRGQVLQIAISMSELNSGRLKKSPTTQTKIQKHMLPSLGPNSRRRTKGDAKRGHPKFCLILSCTPLCARNVWALRWPSCTLGRHVLTGSRRGRWANCRNRVQDNGPHSSEFATRLALEKAMPCRTKSWSCWLMMRSRLACATGRSCHIALRPPGSCHGPGPWGQNHCAGHKRGIWTVFSEGLLFNWQVWRRVDAHVEPQLRAGRLDYDVHVRCVKHWPGQAVRQVGSCPGWALPVLCWRWGRLAGQAWRCAHSVVTPSVHALGTACGVAAVLVQNVCAPFARPGRFVRIFVLSRRRRTQVFGIKTI